MLDEKRSSNGKSLMMVGGGGSAPSDEEAEQEERKSDSLLKKTRKMLKQTQPTKKPKKEFMSPTYAHKLGYDFKLPKFDAGGYIQYIDSVIFGKKRKELLMEPIPPEVGMLKFCIRRVVTIMNKLTPSYYLYIEKRDGGSINLLFGKKVAFKKLSYY